MPSCTHQTSETAVVAFLCSGLQQHLERFEMAKLHLQALAESCDLMLALVRRVESAPATSVGQGPTLGPSAERRA